MSEAKTTPENEVQKFTLEQLARSRKYAAKRDVLYAVLDHEKQYTREEVDKAIEVFNKRDLSKGGKK